MYMSCHYLSISLHIYFMWFKNHKNPGILQVVHFSSYVYFMTADDSRYGTEVKFEIWDTAGQERFRSLAPMYYRRYISVLWYVVMLYERHQDGMFIKVDCYGLLWLVISCMVSMDFLGMTLSHSPIPGVVQNELKEREWKRRTQAPITFQLLEVCGTLDLPCQTYVGYRPWQNWSWTIASWQTSRHDFQTPVTLL